jgi:hypothetical protein
MIIDFSKVVSNNPLAGGSTRQNEVEGVKLDFSYAAPRPQTAEQKANKLSAFVSMVRTRHASEKQFRELVEEKTKEAREAMDRHAMAMATLERGRIAREHANGGDALYAEVERILAAPLGS